MRPRLTAFAMLVGLVLALVPGAAQARVTKGPCDGWVQFQNPDNTISQRYTPANDSPSTAIPIPDEDGVIVEYNGQAPFDNSNHEGAVFIHIAGARIEIEDWGITGPEDETFKQDLYALDDAKDTISKFIPFDFLTGLYKVSADHKADGGECSGFVMVEIGGSPLNNVVGWIVIVGLVVTGSGVYFAGRAIPVIAGKRRR